jgi:hypothetical protein
MSFLTSPTRRAYLNGLRNQWKCFCDISMPPRSAVSRRLWPICCIVQAAVGCSATLKRTMCRRIRGVEEVITAARSPWQNPFAERVIGSLRRERLGHVIELDENYLRKLKAKAEPWGECASICSSTLSICIITVIDISELIYRHCRLQSI